MAGQDEDCKEFHINQNITMETPIEVADPASIPTREFKVTLSIEDGKFRADFENDGYRAALLSDSITGDFQMDSAFVRNFTQSVSEILMDRFYPDICPAFKTAESTHGLGAMAVVDEEEMSARKTRHAAKFGGKP
jgi:hypothetical protein